MGKPNLGKAAEAARVGFSYLGSRSNKLRHHKENP